MNTLITIRSFLLPQYKSLLQELPDQSIGDHVVTLNIDTSQWNTFYSLNPGDTYGYGRVMGKGFKKVDINDVKVPKSNKVTVMYRVERGIGEDKFIKVQLAFHGEFPEGMLIQNLNDVNIPINWAVVCYDGSAKKLTKNKWS